MSLEKERKKHLTTRNSKFYVFFFLGEIYIEKMDLGFIEIWS